MFIDFAKTEFNCPKCGKEHTDSDDKYLKVMNLRNDFSAPVNCQCGHKFRVTYNLKGEAVTYERK